MDKKSINTQLTRVQGEKDTHTHTHTHTHTWLWHICNIQTVCVCDQMDIMCAWSIK